MKLNISNDQLQLMLETIAKAHVMEAMMGKDNTRLTNLIESYSKSLTHAGKEEIFHNVFRPAPQDMVDAWT